MVRGSDGKKTLNALFACRRSSRRWCVKVRKGAPQPAPGELQEQTAEIEESGRFDVVAAEHLDWTVDYTAELYIDLLRTFSGHMAMAPLAQEHLFNEIRRRVERRPSGTVRRGWGTVLHVARKR